MTTSADTTLALTGLDIVSDAFEKVGVKQMSADLDSEIAVQGLRFLNLMIKTWNTKPRLWLLTEASLPLTAATASYNLTTLLPTAFIRNVLSVRRRTGTGTSINDLPLTEWSREDYFDFPSKGSQGTPVNYYVDRQLASTVLYLWPVPTTAVAAATTLKFTYARQIEMFTLVSTADLPEEWFDALTWNLAERLLAIYPNPDTAPEIRKQAAETLAAIISDDQESGSLFFQPAL